MDKLKSYINSASDLIINYAASVLLAIVVFIIGWWLINRLRNLLVKWMTKKEIDITLRPFLKSVMVFSLRVMLIVAVAGMVGVKMTSFIAVLGAAGLAIGLALQGSLSNFAGGVIILILKPFKVGDFVEFKDIMGTIRVIHVFYTYITTIHNQEVVIPNGQLANQAITNYSMHENRRMDITFKVGYEADLSRVKVILEDIITSEPALLADPQHSIFVQELADHYIIINIRAWFKSSDYWPVRNSLSETVKNRFEKEGIRIPYPVMDINLSKA